jgi:hypothetical protein
LITRHAVRIGAGLDEELVAIVGKTFRVGVATDIDDPISGALAAKYIRQVAMAG